MSLFRREGGGCHEVSMWCVAAVLFFAICLVTLSPAAHQACGGPPVTGSAGGHMTVTPDVAPQNAANPPSPLGLGPAIRNAVQPLPPITSRSETGATNAAAKPPEEGNDRLESLPHKGTGHAANDTTLTADEMQMLRRMLDRSRATARDVAWVTAANIATAIFIVGLAFIILLVALRYIFNRWFDAHIYDNTWASTVVVVTIILSLCAVLVAAVR